MRFSLYIAALLPLLLSGQPKSDSIDMLIITKGKKTITHILSTHQQQNDSLPVLKSGNLTGHQDKAERSFHNREFYDNLKDAASQREFTRWIHELMIKDQAAKKSPSTRPLRGENRFTAYKGKTIREIDFRSVNLFAPGMDESYIRSNNRLEKIGMFFHFNTNKRVIQNNLLFNKGDELDPFLLTDNERILRQLTYLEDVRIYVHENELDPEYVDLVIVTKDRWSRGFDMDMSEIDRGEIELYDRNILGFGQQVDTKLHFDAGKDKPVGFETGLRISNLGRSFINTDINYYNAYGNNIFQIKSGRSFITPSMKYAGGIEYTSSTLIDDFKFPDMTFSDQELNFSKYDFWFGRSVPLPGKDLYNRRNIYITSRFNRNVFYERPEISENVRYNFHTRDIFLLSVGYTRLGYLKSNYIYGFGPTEDIPVGSRLTSLAGYESNQFFPRWYGGISFVHSSYIYRTAYLQNEIYTGGFFNDGNFEQGIISIKSSGFSSLINLNRFYLRQFLSLNFTRGIARFEDELVSISNHNGIRGLRSDNLTGKQKLTVQLETMFYSKTNWYGFRYAFYTMADLGWIGPGTAKIINGNFYSGFGIGIRVRNEHMVLPTLKFRLAWFPKLPESASANYIYIMSERKYIYDEFKVTSPDILPYR